MDRPRADHAGDRLAERARFAGAVGL